MADSFLEEAAVHAIKADAIWEKTKKGQLKQLESVITKDPYKPLCDKICRPRSEWLEFLELYQIEKGDFIISSQNYIYRITDDTDFKQAIQLQMETVYPMSDHVRHEDPECPQYISVELWKLMTDDYDPLVHDKIRGMHYSTFMDLFWNMHARNKIDHLNSTKEEFKKYP